MERISSPIYSLIRSGSVQEIGKGHFCLELASSKKIKYQLGQLDDYKNQKRSDFFHYPSLQFSVTAQVSHQKLPGTWGFGFWNDPFSISLGFGGGVRRLPAFPNAAWFFYASPPNYLAFRDNLPSEGYLASTFRTAKGWNLTTPIAGLGFPLLWWRYSANILRKLMSKIIQQDAICFSIDPTEWHAYKIIWKPNITTFIIDNAEIYSSHISPIGPLGLVIWVDNQYASLAPNDLLRFGSLPATNNHWLRVKDINIEKIS